MKRGFKSWFLRALLLVGLVVFVALAWVGVEAVRGPVAPVEEHRVLDQELFSGDALPALAPESAGAASVDALEIVLRLEEGDHVVRGGAPAGAVRIDATYDTANYELSSSVEDREGRLSRYEVDFQRTTSALRSLLTSMKHDVVANELQVLLPEGVPIDLTVELRRGEFELDLSGLSIARLSIDGGMGEVDLTFDRENPIAMDSLGVRMKMGELRARGLGHADARRIDLRGRMGEFTLGFEGRPRFDSEVVVRVTMGSANLSLPEGMPFSVLDTSSTMGEVYVRRDLPQVRADPGVEPPAHLLLDLGVRMGEIGVR